MDCKLVPVLVPKALIPALDKGVEAEDSDRCKFIRRAIREKLLRMDISLTEPEAA